MELPEHKTRIVATIGPASRSRAVLEGLIGAGMDVARLNFSHGELADHGAIIAEVRAAAAAVGRRVAIMADLPGPKIRVGQVAGEPVELRSGDPFVLTTRDVTGDSRRASVCFAALPGVVKADDRLFVNDGLIELAVENVTGEDVHCRVVVGGELSSRKGLNLPGIDLGISAFTARDRECLAFALEQGVDMVSQSFVASAGDLHGVRQAAAAQGHHPFVIAKIERRAALDHIDEIMNAADGIMVARGDLGVEIPMERMAVVQKELIATANALGKPVITATQMLESMVSQRRPTRAEATDVANAILDGTDAVMLSGESAVGAWPVESVATLARIAAATEPYRSPVLQRDRLVARTSDGQASPVDLIALAISRVFERAAPVAVFVPTLSGATARSIARFRLPVFVVAVTPHRATCQALQLSYGVIAEYRPEPPSSWSDFVREWLAEHGVSGAIALLTEGPSARNPEANNRLEIVDLRR